MFLEKRYSRIFQFAIWRPCKTSTKTICFLAKLYSPWSRVGFFSAWFQSSLKSLSTRSHIWEWLKMAAGLYARCHCNFSRSVGLTQHFRYEQNGCHSSRRRIYLLIKALYACEQFKKAGQSCNAQDLILFSVRILLCSIALSIQTIGEYTWSLVSTID